MNITFWSDSLIPSTTANSIQVMKMCDAFTELGNNIVLHAKKNNFTDINMESDIASIYGVKSDFKLLRHRSLGVIKHLDYDLAILNNILRSKPDLIYTRSLRGAFWGNLLNKRTILELHYLPVTRANRWMLKRLSDKHNLIKIITISETLKKMLLENHPNLNAIPIQVCHDAIDIDRFPETPNNPSEMKLKLKIDPGRKIVMYVGHLYKGRGIDLIEQLAQIQPDLEFVLIGGLPKDVHYRRTKAIQLGLNNLRYLGFIPNSKLNKYYQIADALIMPYERKVSVSGGGDTSGWMSPLKTFEYMASGKPLISSDLPSLRETLNADNSVLVEPGNLEQWKYSIEYTLTNIPFANKISRNARRQAEQNTWLTRAENILRQI